MNLGDEGEKVDRTLQQVRKDPAGKVNHLKQLTIMPPPLQSWTRSMKEQIHMKLRQYFFFFFFK